MSLETSMQNQQSSMRSWLTPTAIIAACTALGYSLAYVREATYCSIFAIPKEFIVLSWTTILICISGIFAAVILFGLSLAIYKSAIEKRAHWGPIKKRLVFAVLETQWMWVIVIPYPNTWQYFSYIPLCALTFYLIFSFLIGPLTTQRSVVGYRAKLKGDDAREEKLGSPVDSITRKTGYKPVLLLCVIVMLFGLSCLDAVNTANSKDFLVPSTNQQIVVLRIYGDNIICAPVDREAKTVERTFTILKMDGITLVPEDIGPLKLKADIKQ